MEFGFEIQQEQRPRHLPRLIEANYLLHLSAQELQAVISTELAENPALELEEEAICPHCRTPLEGGSCSNCVRVEETPAPLLRADDGDWGEVAGKGPQPDDDVDPISLISNAIDQRAELTADLCAVLPSDQELLGMTLVESLDERGFLALPDEEIATLARSRVETVQIATRLLQELAPPGVGAHDLRESLLLQVNYLREHDIEVPDLVEPLVSEHLNDLGAHRYHVLARTFRVDADDIAQAHDFIRNHLSPQPWSRQQAATSTAVSDVTFIRPDVVVTITDKDEIIVKVTGTAERALRLNGLYQELATSLRSSKTKEACPLETDDDKAHVRDAVTRARQFMGKLQQRRETLERISLCAITMQEAFIRHGVRELRPLTRADVANHLGIHESTVSRATAGKFVMLPNHRVVPFSDFFSASLSAKDAIRELIEREAASGRTLSDREIGQRLLEQGYRVARRTVAKYRSELGILPSTIRA
jgi:RNA polymerase sigma-54 factor